MELNERIKVCRMKAGLTQEQVAEELCVSRQAVTKWENGQSAPSTEKLFKLAELFGTTVDLLLTEKRTETQPLDNKKSRRYNAVKMVLFTILWYMLILGCGFLLHYAGLMEDGYLFFWLLNSGSLIIVLIVSVILVVLGWNRVAFSLSVSCVIGLVIGTVLGPNPEGAALGYGHYGWAYWIFIMLAGLIIGFVLECIYTRKVRKNIENST